MKGTSHTQFPTRLNPSNNPRFVTGPIEMVLGDGKGSDMGNLLLDPCPCGDMAPGDNVGATERLRAYSTRLAKDISLTIGSDSESFWLSSFAKLPWLRAAARSKPGRVLPVQLPKPFYHHDELHLSSLIGIRLSCNGRKSLVRRSKPS